MNAEIRQRMPVDDIKMCVHVDADCCECRKPKPGLLIEAAAERGILLAASYMVGDRWRDTEAGRAVGCTSILVDVGYQQDGPHRPDKIVRSLPEAVDFIIEHERLKGQS
jgi:D-glycero-D-manno-heptose 1,7-bisphosphate phosphatase